MVAVSIPIFTGKLEETRETTDIANMRAAKAASVEALLSEDYKTSWLEYGGYYTAVFDADRGVFVGDRSYEKAYGQGTEKDIGMTYYPNGESSKSNNVEGKVYLHTTEVSHTKVFNRCCYRGKGKKSYSQMVHK